MKRWLRVFTCVALVALGQRATRATEVGGSPSALVNVVLIEIDTASEAVGARRFETGDWRFWDQAAPRLLKRLESDLGRVRAGADRGPEASLHSVRCTAANLDDGQRLGPLAEHLDGISKQTNRPSLLVVWLADQGSVLLASHGSQEQQATDAFVALARVYQPHAPEALGVAARGVAPPCVLMSGSPSQARQPNARSLDQTLRDNGLDALSHCIVVAELHVARFRTAGMSGPALPPGTEMQVAIHVTDWGINQYEDGVLKTGDDFRAQGVKSVFENVPRGGQILVVMPPHEQFARMSDQEFTRQVYDTLKTRVSGGLAGGVKEYEVQLIQHIGTLTYFDSTHQAAVNRFAKCAYTAIGMLDNDLKAQGNVPRVDAWLTSNGTKTFTENVSAWKGHVTSASLFDGRAYKEPTAEAIRAIGPENIRIFNTAGDAPAPNNPLARSIGNHDVTRALKQEFPTMTAGWLDPLDRFDAPFAGHTAGLNSRESFLVKYVQPDGRSYSTPVRIMGSDLKQFDSLGTQSRQTVFSSSAPDLMRNLRSPLPPRDERIVPYKPRDLYAFGGGPPPPPPGGGAVPVTNVDHILRNTFPRSYGLNDSMMRSSRSMFTVRPAGILFHPELEIVADESGLTAAKAQQAVAAVQGTKAGGEFRLGGQSYLAVKAPGTANLFRVTAGRFQLTHHDLCLRLPSGSSIELNRYYDSSSAERSVLGPGWTFLPLALRVGQTAKVGKAGAEFARKPVLVDGERAVELAYQMESPDESVSGAGTEAPLPQYRPETSLFQPCLTARSDGGYLLLYAHGLQAAFDRRGRLEWMGPSETGRVRYTFESERLTEVIMAEARVSLQYEKDGRLCAAVASDSRRVTYVLDEAHRLAEVSGAADGSFVFTYDTDNRLSRVQRVGEGASTTLAQLRYDAKGRMLSQRTPAGLWRFRYDDRIGRVTATLPSGKDVSYYYNGKQQLVAYGSSPDDVTLFNYDALGRIFQVASGQLLNPAATGERPRFKVTKMITSEI